MGSHQHRSPSFHKCTIVTWDIDIRGKRSGLPSRRSVNLTLFQNKSALSKARERRWSPSRASPRIRGQGRGGPGCSLAFPHLPTCKGRRSVLSPQLPRRLGPRRVSSGRERRTTGQCPLLPCGALWSTAFAGPAHAVAEQGWGLLHPQAPAERGPRGPGSGAGTGSGQADLSPSLVLSSGLRLQEPSEP